MHMQRLFDYYLFVGLGQCLVLSYLKAQPSPPPPIMIAHYSHTDSLSVKYGII